MCFRLIGGGFGGRWSRFWHFRWPYSTFWDSVLISGPFLTKFNQNFESVFSVDWVVWGSQVTVLALSLTLLYFFGFFSISGPLFDQTGPKFRKGVIGRLGGFGGRWSRFWHFL